MAKSGSIWKGPIYKSNRTVWNLNWVQTNDVGVRAKSLEETLVFIEFSNAFDSIRRKDGENTACMCSSQRNCYRFNDALQKNTKAMVRSPDRDIVTSVLQGYILEPYLFILCLDYVLQTPIDLIKENRFIQKKKQEADDTQQYQWFGLVLWHINHCRLFSAKSSLYIYIRYIWFVNISQQS